MLYLNQSSLAPPWIVEACVTHVGSTRLGESLGCNNKADYAVQKREAFERWSAYVAELSQPTGGCRTTNGKIAPWRLRKAMLQLGLASWADPDATTAVLLGDPLEIVVGGTCSPNPKKERTANPSALPAGVRARAARRLQECAGAGLEGDLNLNGLPAKNTSSSAPTAASLGPTPRRSEATCARL